MEIIYLVTLEPYVVENLSLLSLIYARSYLHAQNIRLALQCFLNRTYPKLILFNKERRVYENFILF